MKKLICLFLVLSIAVSLCACGSIYDSEYVVIGDYQPQRAQTSDDSSHVNVSKLYDLKTAILRMVNSGETDGTVVFSSEYEGDISEDMATACWQIRSQYAVCAYCVENISYELSRIVSYDEAKVHISYSEYAIPISEIVRLTYFTGIQELLLTAMQSGRDRIVISINNSTYTAVDVETLAEEVYRRNPSIVPASPEIRVNLYTGSGLQKLYEIEFAYGLDEDTYNRRMEELSEAYAVSDSIETDADPYKTALSICSHLFEHTVLSNVSGTDSVYSVLVNGVGNSEGMALTYKDLCDRFGITCTAVYGTKERDPHCWNIITIDGESYHVDVSACIEKGNIEEGFLITDRDIWTGYRWDTTAYPVCEGSMTYAEIAGITIDKTADAAVNGEETPVDETAPVSDQAPSES